MPKTNKKRKQNRRSEKLANLIFLKVKYAILLMQTILHHKLILRQQSTV